MDAVVSLYLLRKTHGVIGSDVSGYSICAGWDCGLINLPPDKCYNFSWSRDALTFKSPTVITPFLSDVATHKLVQAQTRANSAGIVGGNRACERPP